MMILGVGLQRVQHSAQQLKAAVATCNAWTTRVESQQWMSASGMTILRHHILPQSYGKRDMTRTQAALVPVQVSQGDKAVT
jgi:hypothetical protein